jgi:hypothetical protein
VRAAGLLALLLLASCTQPSEAPSPSESRSSANPEKYARDRDLCRAQVGEYVKTRRDVDDSRREVFRGAYDRYGQTTLPTDMNNYDDQRRSDRLIANCMETRGWGQPQRSWWQKIGS